MAKICPLFSGSTGNCTYIEHKDTAVLVDIGVSAKKTTEALVGRGLDLSKIKGVFVTHEHGDHISGIRVFCSKNNIPVFMTKGTHQGIIDNDYSLKGVNVNILEDETDMFDFGVKYFHTMHDVNESCGFTFDLGSKKIGVCTDLGVVTDEVRGALAGCDTVMLESNHDPKMLQNNESYPFHLKRRIMSENGHLSNNACAEEIVRLAKLGSTRFILAHLSRENNLPYLASETTRSLLLMSGLQETRDYFLSVAAPQENELIIL